MKKALIFLFLILTVAGGAAMYYIYQKVFSPNRLSAESVVIYIPTDATFQQVIDTLSSNEIINDPVAFEWLSRQKKYDTQVKPGKYSIKNGMSNNGLINHLRSGNQEPVRIKLDGIRYKEQLAGKVGLNLETDSATMLKLLNDDHYLSKSFGLNSEKVMTLFLPDTYEFFWNTSAEDFLARMAQVYKQFWTDERKAKARQKGFSQSEVMILASIVQAEQSKWDDEKPRVAGLYVNRLKKGMKLESDPTVVYANNNFGVNRVLKADKVIDSRYNTYKYPGLPPGPIVLPERSTIDAVLNHENHDYIFMVAKEDFSGKHYFATNFNDHCRYAKKYQQALDQKNIYR